MAMDDFDPEVMRELLGNLEALSASLGPLAVKMGQMSGSIDQTGAAVNKEGEAIKANVKVREGESKAVQASRQANQELTAASEALQAGFTNLKGATVSFADALLKGEGQFASYNKAIDGLGNAAFEAGKAFGPLGMAIGGAIKAISKVAQVFTEQADAQNQFVTRMYEMGAVSGQNSETLTDMARAAGYAAEDLEKLGPIFKAAGQGLTTLGGTTGEGTEVFGRLLKAANENERAFYRIGYSLEELQETQGAYVELQRQSGINLQQRGFDEAKLAKDSLNYAKNLRMLSDLTGKSAETLQAEQQAARNAYENVIANRADEAKIRKMETELASTTDQARKEQLQKEIDEMKNSSAVRNEAIGRMANDFGPEFGAQFGKVLRTGAFDESTKGLAVLGLSAADLKKKFEGVEEGTPEFDKLMAETAQEIRQKQDERIGQFGTSLQFGGEELGRQIGLAKEAVMEGGKIDPQDEVGRRKAAQREIDERMQSGDAQRDSAAALIETERNVRTAADAALDALNPLTNGFDKGTIALEALTVAAGVAAAAMGMSAFSGAGGAGGMMSKLGGLFRGGGAAASATSGAGATAATTAANTARVGGTAMRGLGQLAGRAAVPGLAAGFSIYEGYQHASKGRERAEQDLDEGKISEQEAGRRKTQATAEGTGQAIGGAGGALAGAAAGAAIGSVVPVIGTAIGGIIGGIAGAWLGSEGGEVIGGALGEAMTITPEMEEYNRANLDLVSQMGIYNENWLGASEVNMEALRAGIEEGTVTKDMVQAMMMDNDLTDQQLRELTDIASGMEGPGVDALTEGASEEEMAAMLAEREQRQTELIAEQQQATADQIAAEEQERAERERLLAEQRENEKNEAQLIREQRLAEADRKRQQEAWAQGAEDANTALAALSGQAGDAIETASESMVTAAGELTLEGAEGELGGEIGKFMTPLMASMFPGFGVLPNLFEKVSNYLNPESEDGEAEKEISIMDLAKKATMAIPGVGLLASAGEGLMSLFNQEPDLETVEGRRELFAEGTDEEWAQQTGGALGGYLEHLQNELEIIGLDATTATEEQMTVVKENAKRAFLDDKYGQEITSEVAIATESSDDAYSKQFDNYIKSVNALGEVLITKTRETEDDDGNYISEKIMEYANTVEGSLDRADGKIRDYYNEATGEESYETTGDLATHEFVDVWNTSTEALTTASTAIADAIKAQEEVVEEKTTSETAAGTTPGATNQYIEQLLAQNQQLMGLMENRLGSIAGKLEDANDINNKILQYGRV